MKRQIYGLLGVVACTALMGACKKDPLASTGGNLQRVDFQYAYLEVVVGDSVRTFVTERDALNTLLPPKATLRSCNAAVATVSTVSDAPQQRTGFFLKGVSFGTTCIIAESGGVADTMQVATFPAGIRVSTGPDTIASRDSAAYGYQFLDAAGNVITGPPAPTWSTSDTVKARASSTGMVRAFALGDVNLRVTGIGTAPAGVTGLKAIFIKPGPFPGTFTPSSGAPLALIKIARATLDPAFDADTKISVNGIRTFVDTGVAGGITADTVRFYVPATAAVGAFNLLIENYGPDQYGLQAPFTVSSAAVLDASDPGDDVSSAPTVIAANIRLYRLLSGKCKNGARDADPVADCQDWYSVTNSLARVDTITAQADWYTAADLDVAWFKPSGDSVRSATGACTSTVQQQSGQNTPFESSAPIIPAGETWRVRVSACRSSAVPPATIYRFRINGKG